MRAVLVAVLKSLVSVVRSRTALQIEVSRSATNWRCINKAGAAHSCDQPIVSSGHGCHVCGPGGERPW